MIHIYILSILLALCFTSCASKYPAEDAGYDAINAYGKKAAENHDWVLFGTGGSFVDNISKLNLSFRDYKEVEIAEARQLIVIGVEEFLKDVNDNKKLIPYLIIYPFTYKNLRFSIGFSDPKTDRFISNGHIAFVSLQNGKVYYSVANENQNLQDSYAEPYPEAYKIVTGHALPDSSNIPVTSKPPQEP